MGLPDSYFSYPRRSYGMDHDFYEWSMLPTRAPVRWPNGARVAFWVTVALEFFPLDQPVDPFRAPGGMITPYPDLRHYTLRDYGNRVGVFRVFKVLDDLGVTPSVAINSKVAERYPRLVDAANERGCEIIAYGIDMGQLHHAGLARQLESEMIDQALDTVRTLSGQNVVGWWSPARSTSANTIDLVARRGIRYVCDWCNDDMPYEMTTPGGTLHSMPLGHELDDQTIMSHYQQNEREFVEQIRDAYRALDNEAANHDGGRILSLVIHPWVSGQPHRIKALRSALSSVLSHDGVWSASGQQILDSFLARSTS